MLEIYLWMLFTIFTQINFAVLIFNGCAKKKKESEPQKLPKCPMKVKSASASGKDKKNNKESPANTPKSDENNKTAGSPKGKSTILITWKSSKEGIKGGDGKKVPAKGAIITQVKDAVKTDRKDDEGGGGGGGKGKLVSNPIVSAATEPFPTMAQPIKEQQITTEETQSERIHTDKTQKDS